MESKVFYKCVIVYVLMAYTLIVCGPKCIGAQIFKAYTKGPILVITQEMIGNETVESFTGVSINDRGNSVTGIGDDAFALLPNVEKIYLSGNNIESASVSEYAFRNLSKLYYLDLSANPAIKDIITPTWTDYLKARLESLVLQATEFDDRYAAMAIMNHYHALLSLDMSGTRSKFVLGPVTNSKIETLMLHSCSLIIEDTAFEGLHNLTTLTLNFVDMLPTTQAFIEILTQELRIHYTIEHLDLNDNSITAIDLTKKNKTDRKDFVNMKYLSLARNNFDPFLPILSPGIYEKLKEIDLAEAIISVLNFEFGGIFRSLEKLTLRDNDINNNKVSSLLQNVKSNMRYLDISGNWQVNQFPDLGNFNTLEHLNLHGLTMKEIHESDFELLTKLTFLDIGMNELLTVSDMRNHLSSLNNLNIFPQYVTPSNPKDLVCNCSLAWLKISGFDTSTQEKPCSEPESLRDISWTDISYEMIIAHNDYCTALAQSKGNDCICTERVATDNYKSNMKVTQRRSKSLVDCTKLCAGTQACKHLNYLDTALVNGQQTTNCHIEDIVNGIVITSKPSGGKGWIMYDLSDCC